MLHNIKARQPELGITNRDILLVKIAGLCHDLGHGPFSHVFDNEFIPAVADKMQQTADDPKTPTAERRTLEAEIKKLRTWKHEDASEMMLEAALEDAGLLDPEQEEEPFSDEEVMFIKALINPERHPQVYANCGKQYLFEIVSNSRNSVDVDKFDYISRDCYMVGIKASHDPRRLMLNCRVIDNQVCFHAKEVYPLYELFHTRYSLFKQVYSHRVVKSLEYMICDILKLADPVLHISSGIHTADAYLKLTDCILKTIEISDDPKLQPARDLCRKLRKRQLYKMAAETLLPPEAVKAGRVTAEDIVRYRRGEDALEAKDVIVHNMTLNYAKKDRNPVESIKFFNSWDATEAVSIPRERVSLLIPERFQERYLRVFVRSHDDDALLKSTELATKRFVAERFNSTLGATHPLRLQEVRWCHSLSQLLSSLSVVFFYLFLFSFFFPKLHALS